jgi:hypothetical protein
MSKLLDYLNHLDKNADARTAHAADPATSMTKDSRQNKLIIFSDELAAMYSSNHRESRRV